MNDEWIFIPQRDSHGGDMYFIKGKCDLNSAPPDCVAVNTLGFYKSSIVFPLVESPYFSDTDGVYLRKSALPECMRVNCAPNIDPSVLNKYLIEFRTHS